MRITGGTARGIRLQTPKGDATRPATDKLRQAVFSSLGERVEGARFADLFAGTGSYGLEALSRGAAGGWFIESHRPTAALLGTNLAAVARSAGIDPKVARILPVDVLAGWQTGAAAEGVCRLIFIDPPYERIPLLWVRLFELSGRLLSTEETARVMIEIPADLHPSPVAGWEETRRLDAGGGQPTASFWRRVGP